MFKIRKVLLHVNRRHSIKDVIAKPLKLIQPAKDCGAMQVRCDKIKKALKMTIDMRCLSDKIHLAETHAQNRGGHLIKNDAQSKLIRKLMEKKTAP